jgi:2-polyprenyl-3-methyl-5-hydroxy-6-metoxy-1,4-benzoquinol methylase
VLPAAAEITLIMPAGNGGPAGPPALPPALKLFPAQPGLRERFADYDLLVTHFGLTAFEALYARLPVLLVSPTAYHEKLAKHAGFISVGRGPIAVGRLSRLFSRPGFYQTLCRESENLACRHGLEETQSQTLGDFFADCKGNLTTNHTNDTGPLARFSERTYCRQKETGLIVMKRLTPPPIEYETDYFFGQYKKQYGKTYLEDFPNLVSSGRRRLTHIKALLKANKGPRNAAGTPASPALLDIGCAYGPFLAAARDEGFAPAGIEPADDAARYVREELDIPCAQGFFPAAVQTLTGEADKNAAGESLFDAVTLWYVIEHFETPGAVLQAIHRILKPGGVLAFSTPSFSGVSGRKSQKNFLKNSPPDHWTIWSPRTCVPYLKQYGFKVKKIVVTGHHPERFPLIGGHLRVGGLIYRVFFALSKIFRLGDTFEVYAVKGKKI